jgi:hypothetical protein
VTKRKSKKRRKKEEEITLELYVLSEINQNPEMIKIFLDILSLAVEDGGSMFMRNAGIYLRVRTVLLPRRIPSNSKKQLVKQTQFKQTK